MISHQKRQMVEMIWTKTVEATKKKNNTFIPRTTEPGKDNILRLYNNRMNF